MVPASLKAGTIRLRYVSSATAAGMNLLGRSGTPATARNQGFNVRRQMGARSQAVVNGPVIPITKATRSAIRTASDGRVRRGLQPDVLQSGRNRPAVRVTVVFRQV